MKAAVLHEVGKPLEIEDVAIATPAVRGSDPDDGDRRLP